MLKFLRLWWHAFSTRRKMNRVFSRKQDPYGYRDSPYEMARLAAMEAAVAGPCASALEVGCAEGAFTVRLAALAREVVALDISKVALERAAARFSGNAAVHFDLADIRTWEPGRTFSTIVLGDVLYYLDKPLVQEEFRETFPPVAGWLAPGGRLLLAHGFAGAAERPLREGYRKRFEELGLERVSETVIGEGEADGKVCCLLSVLKKKG